MVTTRPPKTIVKPTAPGPVVNTDTKLLIYGLFQKGRVLAQGGIESVCAPPIAEHPWPNHGGGQRWSLTRSPLRWTVPPLMLRVPTIINDEGHATDAPMGASAVKCWRPSRNLFAC